MPTKPKKAGATKNAASATKTAAKTPTKAATKGASKTPLEVPAPWSVGCAGGAFEAGDAAFGLSHLRARFGKSADDDRLFALGYPHVVIPADVEVDFAALSAKDALTSRYYPWRGGVWPRGLVERMAAVFDKVGPAELGAPAPPLDADKTLRKAALTTAPYGEVRLYLAEALCGTARALDAALDAWESIAADEWDDHDGLAAPYGVPFLLLRVAKKQREQSLARLEALHARAKREMDAQENRSVEAFGVAALDRETIDALFAKRPLWGARYLDPGDARVESVVVPRLGALKAADRAQFDARIAFVGGDPTTQALAGAWDGFHTTWRAALVEQLARVAHPAAKKALTALAAKGDARAKAWSAT
jgi:hypothetical protein